jgi:hypothetical protein
VRADLTHQAAASSPDERDQPGQVPFEAADPVGHVAQFARGWLGEHGAGAVDALAWSLVRLAVAVIGLVLSGDGESMGTSGAGLDGSSRGEAGADSCAHLRKWDQAGRGSSRRDESDGS